MRWYDIAGLGCFLILVVLVVSTILVVNELVRLPEQIAAPRPSVRR